MSPKPQPLLTPLKRLSGRREAVTVCIAAICKKKQNRDTIVCVSDMKLSQHHYSEDIAAIKLRRVHQHWYAMIAGTFGQRQSILNEVRETFRSATNAPVTEMQGAFVSAYQKYGRQLATESVLAPYGLTLEEFLSRRAEIGDTIFEGLWGEIGRVKVGCEFLVCGFDNIGHIFSVSNPTADNPSFITPHDDLGFGTIGSGAYVAESSLYAYQQSHGVSLEVSIYQTCAAKFSSESATDVGDATHVKIIQKDKIIEYDIFLADDLKPIWRKNRLRIPRAVFKIIKKASVSRIPTSYEEEDM
jgi:hypothetical protein